MKKSPLLLNLGLLLATWTVSVAGPLAAQFEAPRPSPKATVTQRIGLTDFALSYSRPSVKGRAIWGALVPYDKPWRTGANEATTLTFGDEITVEGKRLAAGTYSLVTIPGKDEWTVIFNTDTALWAQTDYAEAKDVLRVKVKPQAAENRETLQIGFDNLTATSGELAIAWEKLRIPVKVEVEVRNKAIAKAREAVAKAKADDWETPLAVGRYFADEKISLPEALNLVDKSIAIKKTPANLGRKARILAENGRVADAITVGSEAVALAKTLSNPPNMEALEKLLAEWKAKK